MEACAETLFSSSCDFCHASFLGDVKLSLRDPGYRMFDRFGKPYAYQDDLSLGGSAFMVPLFCDTRSVLGVCVPQELLALPIVL